MEDKINDLKLEVVKLTGDGSDELEGMVPAVCRLLSDHIAEQKEANRIATEQMAALRHDVDVLKQGQHRIRKALNSGAAWIVAEDGKWHRVLAIGFLLGSGAVRIGRVVSKVGSVMRVVFRR